MDKELKYTYKGATIWLTGLSGAGKSTIAEHLYQYLTKHHCNSIVLDGDALRNGLCNDLGFSIIDRRENMRRVGEVAKLFTSVNIITITALISPLHADRAKIRSLFKKNQFLEIYCKASLKTCEQRDIKGLYKKARQGEIPFFTGIDSPYEEPSAPELVLDTENLTIEQCIVKVIELMQEKNILNQNTGGL